MVGLTGGPQAASQLLRHKNLSVTMAHYIKHDRAAVAAGLKLLEEQVAKRNGD